jgi:hypothetical protein
MRPTTKCIVWHDADGRILMTNIGPYDEDALEKIRTGPQPAGGTMLVTEIDQVQGGGRPSVPGHYVKNGKVVARPELVPGKGESFTVSSLAQVPDLPTGARVTVNEIDEQVMGAPGKPEVPDTGDVTIRVDAFPARVTTVNLQRGNPPNSAPAPRMVHPKRKTSAKRSKK